MNKDFVKSCTNCVREYKCQWNPTMICDDWKPDEDAKKKMKQENEKEA